MPGAVRCLFPINDTDRKKLNQELDDQSRKIDESDAKRFMMRWGLNPTTGTKVEGWPYEITRLDPRSMPAMYTSGYRHRPSRPVSMLRVRSPCQNQLSPSPTGLGHQRPTKRKLQFSFESMANDENLDISESKQARGEGISALTTDVVPSAVVNSTALSSPPASPPASSIQLYSPPSPSVLSSSCPPVLESEPVSGRLCEVCPVDVPGLSRSLSTSTFVQLSPESQAQEYITPNVRSRPVKLVQREITDYVPIRKARSLKVSPRS